jgi:hypothetical protein
MFGLKPKRKRVPRVALKTLHWQALQPKDLEGTLWYVTSRVVSLLFLHLLCLSRLVSRLVYNIYLFWTSPALTHVNTHSRAATHTRTLRLTMNDEDIDFDVDGFEAEFAATIAKKKVVGAITLGAVNLLTCLLSNTHSYIPFFLTFPFLLFPSRWTMESRKRCHC